MATENLTTYTEADTSNKLSETASKATAVALLMNVDCYLYYDKGASHFNALSVKFEIYCDCQASNIYGKAGIGFTTTAVDDLNGAWDNTDVAFTIGCMDTGAGNPVLAWLQQHRGSYAIDVQDTYAGSTGVKYYCLMERAAASNTITTKIYSDAYATLLDTLIETGYVTTTRYRNCYGFVNTNTGDSDRQFDGYTQNLDLQEAGVTIYPIWHHVGSGVRTGIASGIG